MWYEYAIIIGVCLIIGYVALGIMGLWRRKRD